MMRWMTGLVLAVAALWSGYWWLGERALSTGTAAWFARMADEGRTASYQALDVAGFPSRFDMTLTEPRLGDPATGVEYSAPFVQLLTLSYTPWHVILALPPEQRVTWPGNGVTVRSGKMQASVVMKPVPSVPLDRVVAVGSDVDLRTDSGMAARMATARIALRALAGANEYELGVDLLKLGLEGSLREMADRAGLSPLVEEARVDAVATLTAPLDRFAPEAQPSIAALDLRSATLTWGPLSLSASGKMRADAAGQAEGTITVHLKGWKPALAAMTAAGLLDARTSATIERAAAMMAKGDGLELPLTFAQGRTTLGIFPIGPAPRLR